MTVANLDITSRVPFLDGKPFGDVGPYQLLEGTAHFAVDPLNPRNQAITDIEMAPRDAGGRVRFSADFAMLRPADLDRGNHRVLVDVLNRGRKTVLYALNRASQILDPSAPLEAGNGFLMRRGYTVVWCGWQADVPQKPGLMGLQAPEAVGPDGPLVGRIMCWFQANEPTRLILLSHRDHVPHPPADIDDPSATLFVRDHPNSPAVNVDRDRWSFVRVESEQIEPEPSHIYMSSGFEPGKIYQLVYATRGSKIVGLGFAAIRDMASFLKNGLAEAGNPCAGYIEHAYSIGLSQSGRFLRHLLHTGLNEDEEDRTALDGVISHVAGGLRGEFNQRFGQPSKDICYVSPGLFPFADTEQTDPVTGQTGSLLARLKEQGKLPKIMFTNTSAEYWRGDSALIHTDLETMTDASEESQWVRRYHFAGTRHGIGVFPPQWVNPSDGVRGQLPLNGVDYSPLLRAALDNLDRWVAGDEPPPPSRHPSLADGTSVPSHRLLERFARLPAVRVPPQTTRAMRLDYGPETHLGRTLTLPPIEGEEYPALVSDVDEDCNEVAGIRLPDLAVPVATYTGWNLRHPDMGNPDLFIGITGGLAGWMLPFPATAADMRASRDPRRSIEERYPSREDYIRLVGAAAESLVNERYMLAEDVEGVVEQAAVRYDFFRGHVNSCGNR